MEMFHSFYIFLGGLSCLGVGIVKLAPSKIPERVNITIG